MRYLAALLLMLPVAASAEWSSKDLNWAIDQTNFISDGNCSATLISVPLKLVLTNYHCIDGKVESVEREVTDDDGRVKKIKQRRYKDVRLEQHRYEGYARVGSASYTAEIVAEDKGRDLAVLKIAGLIPHAYASPLGNDVSRLDRVYAVGNPAGLDATAVEGIVSNVNRTFEFPWTGGEKLPMIQFSGGIFGGNSGGALYNDRGELIGVPAAGMASATFIGLAIPVMIVKGFLRDSCLASVFEPDAKDVDCREKKAKKEKTKDD